MSTLPQFLVERKNMPVPALAKSSQTSETLSAMATAPLDVALLIGRGH